MELEHRLLHQKLYSISFGHDAKMPAGRGVNVQRLILAEMIAILLAPLLIFDCKCLFRQPTDAFAVWESGYKVYPLLTAVRPGRAGK